MKKKKKAILLCSHVLFFSSAFLSGTYSGQLWGSQTRCLQSLVSLVGLVRPRSGICVSWYNRIRTWHGCKTHRSLRWQGTAAFICLLHLKIEPPAPSIERREFTRPGACCCPAHLLLFLTGGGALQTPARLLRVYFQHAIPDHRWHVERRKHCANDHLPRLRP